MKNAFLAVVAILSLSLVAADANAGCKAKRTRKTSCPTTTCAVPTTCTATTTVVSSGCASCQVATASYIGNTTQSMVIPINNQGTTQLMTIPMAQNTTQSFNQQQPIGLLIFQNGQYQQAPDIYYDKIGIQKIK